MLALTQVLDHLKLCYSVPQGPSMKDHKYPTAFPLKHQRKDIELALKYAESKQQSLPVAAATTDLYKKVVLFLAQSL